MEGNTQWGKPVFDCHLNIAWRAVALLTPTVKEREHQNNDGGLNGGAGVIESLLNELPAGRLRMAAKIAASKAPRLVAQVYEMHSLHWLRMRW